MKAVYGLVLAIGLIGVCKVSYAKDTVVLDVGNHIVLNGEINEKSVNETIYKIASFPKKSVYLYINSPGGSIHAGSVLINYLKNTKKRVYCVADYAASMAFSIMQYCYKRIVSNNSILMQHEASITLQDSVPNFLSILDMLLDMIRTTETGVAEKLGMSYDKYKEKIADDWWIYGKHAVDVGAADEVRLVYCTNKLIKQTTGGGAGLFGLAIPKVSECPIISPYAATGAGQDKDTWNATYIKQINRYTRYGLQNGN